MSRDRRMSPREELLALVRDFQERVSHTTPAERRAFRALEVLAAPLSGLERLDGPAETRCAQALAILRGETE